jgi:ferredoxin-thioredoxin reductase catalytic subunit
VSGRDYRAEAEALADKLAAYAAKQGMELNADRRWTVDLVESLLVNEDRYGYRSCPCRLAKNDKDADRDIVCPCAYRDPDVAEFGACYCGLYVSHAWNAGDVPNVRVPERRPMEKR